MLLVKVPSAPVSVVCGPAIVGFALVPQQRPLAEMVLPPLLVTFPPPVAVLKLIFVIGVLVVTTGFPGPAGVSGVSFSVRAITSLLRAVVVFAPLGQMPVELVLKAKTVLSALRDSTRRIPFGLFAPIGTTAG